MSIWVDKFEAPPIELEDLPATSSEGRSVSPSRSSNSPRSIAKRATRRVKLAGQHEKRNPFISAAGQGMMTVRRNNVRCIAMTLAGPLPAMRKPTDSTELLYLKALKCVDGFTGRRPEHNG